MRLAKSIQHLQPNLELSRQLEAAAYELEAEHDSSYRPKQAYLHQIFVDSGQPPCIGLLQKCCEGMENIEVTLEQAAEQMDAAGPIDQLRDAFRSLPPDVKQDMHQTAKLMRNVRGLYWARFLAAFNRVFFQNPEGWQQALLSNRAQTVVQLARLAGQSARLSPIERATERRGRGIGGAQVKQYHRRQMQRGIAPGRNRQTSRYRELEYEQALENEFDRASLELEGPEPFFTKVTPIPGIGNKEGHEILTRLAMRGLPLKAGEKSAVELGVIRPDRGGRSYWNFPRAALESFKAAAQPAHSLRPTPSSSVPVALRLIRQRFVGLHRRAMHAKTRMAALAWLGEALHLLQDSFSSAHVGRIGGTGRIRHIRAFYIRFGWPPLSRAPNEHNAPSDPRDDVYLHGALRSEARDAVRASRDFLVMALRHLHAPRSPRNGAELMAFIRRYLT